MINEKEKLLSLLKDEKERGKIVSKIRYSSKPNLMLAYLTKMALGEE